MELPTLGVRIIMVWNPRTVRRTWRERLFSVPWRPWVSLKHSYHPMWGETYGGTRVWCNDTHCFVPEDIFHRMITADRRSP